MGSDPFGPQLRHTGHPSSSLSRIIRSIPARAGGTIRCSRVRPALPENSILPKNSAVCPKIPETARTSCRESADVTFCGADAENVLARFVVNVAGHNSALGEQATVDDVVYVDLQGVLEFQRHEGHV